MQAFDGQVPARHLRRQRGRLPAGRRLRRVRHALRVVRRRRTAVADGRTARWIHHLFAFDAKPRTCCAVANGWSRAVTSAAACWSASPRCCWDCGCQAFARRRRAISTRQRAQSGMYGASCESAGDSGIAMAGRDPPTPRVTASFVRRSLPFRRFRAGGGDLRLLQLRQRRIDQAIARQHVAGIPRLKVAAQVSGFASV